MFPIQREWGSQDPLQGIREEGNGQWEKNSSPTPTPSKARLVLVDLPPAEKQGQGTVQKKQRRPVIKHRSCSTLQTVVLGFADRKPGKDLQAS